MTSASGTILLWKVLRSPNFISSARTASGGRLASLGLASGLSRRGLSQEQALRKAREAPKRSFLYRAGRLEPSVEAVLEEAYERGTGATVKGGLANGRLTGRNPVPDFTNKYKELVHLASGKGNAPEALAVAFARAKHWVM